MTEYDAATPMLKQYFDIKKENPGALIMFRLGDFYEFFGEDARVAARELDIVLTGRDAGTKDRIPMCGVPHHALDQYLGRLIQKGYKVCLCEQLEDPKTVKGLVKRGVVRVVTPGTAMEPSSDGDSVYIAAVLSGDAEHYAAAVCEVSTGQLRLSEYAGDDALERFTAEILRIAPKEILVSENDFLLLTEQIKLWEGQDKELSLITLLPGVSFERESAKTRLDRQFRDLSMRPDRDYPLAGDCAGAILGYLEDTQKLIPAQIRVLEADMSGRYLSMDPTTFRNLEITRNLRTYEKKGSLLDIMDKTRSVSGSRLLRDWLEKPLFDKRGIEDRIDAVSCLHEAWSQRQTLRKLLFELYDMERLMTRVVYQRVSPGELLALKASFSVLPDIRQTLLELMQSLSGQTDSCELSMIHAQIDELQDMAERLDAALTPDIPGNWKEGGFIREGYHSAADELRDSAKNGRSWMLELERKEREQSGIKSLKIGYNKVFGYYFEITKSNLAMAPEHFQRKQTLASAERFITPELTHLEGLVLGAEEKLIALEQELFRELMEYVATALVRVQTTAQALAKLDVYQSMAELATVNSYSRPTILPADSEEIRIKDLRHPIVEQILDGTRFVPNDLIMDAESCLYIITGPNMGGKSTYCRSVALAFIMAQTGSYVPASEADLPLRDQIFARVGASDDLRGGQSTFMMEMNEVAHIMNNATARSLIVLDEVGRGTGTYDGFSVAWAVSRYILTRIKAKTLFATHFLELTDLAQTYKAAKNISIAVEEIGERVVFLHKILQGSASKSYGLHVARLAGLPAEVIADAELKLAELEIQGQVTQEAQTGQLSIFEIAATREARPVKSPASELLAELVKKDLSVSTPIEALNYLYKLQQRLKALDGEL